jgi:hypothetical protein
MRGQSYAIACEECLRARFARLDAERAPSPPAIDQPDDPRLHPCPTCALQGRSKLIPRLWERCAVCDGAHPAVLPIDQWDAAAANALIAHTLRRVDQAWRALDGEQRAEYAALQAELLNGLAALERARQARDMMRLRQALVEYELEAAPLFARLPCEAAS